MRSSTYQTSGRLRLTDFLARNVHKQYSVQALHAALTKEGANIGKSSLYRQLEKLCEEGVVRKPSTFEYLAFAIKPETLSFMALGLN